MPDRVDATSIGVLWASMGSAYAPAHGRALLLQKVNKGETDEKTRFHQIFGLGGYGCAG
ncbi:hypothetical protein [Campylobacter showae]|uniref:hypothetical protein n=1 Tax=Campylobacter showae TaxID=204 RepID=UPI0028EAD03A|nr:hypothetical protein [Campylobacter showae]